MRKKKEKKPPEEIEIEVAPLTPAGEDLFSAILSLEARVDTLEKQPEAVVNAAPLPEIVEMHATIKKLEARVDEMDGRLRWLEDETASLPRHLFKK